MGRCARCGGPTPGNVQGEICPVCRQKMQAAEYEKQKKFNEQYGSKPSSTGSYRPSSGSYQTGTTHRGGFGTVIIIFILIVVAGFFGIRYWNYTSFENNLAREFTIDEKTGGDSTSLIEEINNRKDEYAQWTLLIEKRPNDYASSIFDFISEKEVRIRHWVEDGVDAYLFSIYKDLDMSTGLNGKYYLTTIDGKKCIISRSDKTVYQEGSAFFAEHYEQLMALTYEAVVPELTNKLLGSEYGSNEDYNTTVFKKDSVSASIEKGNNYTTIMDESNDERWRYVLQYSDKASESVPDISDYKVISE